MAIQCSLLERLRNPDPPGQRHLHTSSSEVFDSILVNLQDVLNTNQGNCLTDTRYGMPHMSTIRGSMPWSVAGLMSAIRSTVELHEPRLSNVRVRHAPSGDRGMVLRFEVSAVVEDEEGRRSLRFETYADDEGRMVVR